MKHLYLLTILAFFASCSNNSIEIEYLQENYKLMSEAVNIQLDKNNEQLLNFKDLKEDYPNKIGEFYLQAEAVHNKTMYIIEKTQLMQEFIADKDSISIDDFIALNSQTYTLTDDFINDIKAGFDATKDYLETNISDLQPLLENIYNSLVWNDISAFNEEKVNSAELYALLTNIQYKALIIENMVFNYLFSMISVDYDDSWTSIVRAEFDVDKTEYKIGDTLNAKIKLIKYDSTMNYTIKVDDTDVDYSNGIGVYRTRITNQQIGKQTKQGFWITRNPATGDTIKTPFAIEYEVVE